MIGFGLLILCLLVGLRVAWVLLRFRGLGIFVAMIAVVAWAALGRAGTEPTAAATQEPAPMVVACQNTETGIEACTAAIASARWAGADLAWAYTNRGLAWAARGDLLKALADHAKAIELAPNDPAGWTNRGNAHAILGDLLAALSDHERALELAPESASAWHNRAVDFEELGEHKKALADYRKALTLDPVHVGSHTGLATANCKLSRVKASMQLRLEMITKGLVEALDVQRLLKAEGFYKGPLDGLFGKGSRAALQAWTRKGCLAQS